MRKSIFLRKAVLFLMAVSPAVVCAQFQQPSDDELKMTSDPKAPGAAAVYLDIEENDGLEYGFSSYYARIKVLAEKGKELATVEIPYLKGCEQIALVKGRTIHPDGTIVPLDMKPEDLLEVKSGDDRVQRKVFTLPSVETGSVLEYRYQTQYIACQYYSFLSWEVQEPYFIHKAHYAYAAPGFAADRLVTSQTLPPGAAVKMNGMGHFVLDVTDVPPIPDEKWMPPIDDSIYQVHFIFVNAKSTGEFWMQEAKTWLESVKDFAAPNQTVRAVVAGLIAPGDTDLEKAKKLYAAVQALDNTDFSREKSQSERRRLKLKEVRRAEDTWTQRSGTGNELALLYLSMLRAAGVAAYPMKVRDRDKGTFNPEYTDSSQLDSDVVIVDLGGKEIFLDPGEKMCPFGVLNWNHAGAGGIRDSAEGPEMGSTPSTTYTANTTLRMGDLTVDAHGAVSGTLRFVMTGQEALHWRQEAVENDDAEVRKQFDSELATMVPDGVEAHIHHFLALDQPGANLIAIVDVNGTLGAATAKRLVLPGFFFGARGSEPFVQETQRQTSVDMHYAGMVTDQVTYRLPAGFAVEGAPQDGKILWKEHAVYSSKTAVAPGRIDATRTLARAFTLAKPEEYQDLRGFYQKVAAADQAQLVLTIAPAGKSN